MLCQAKKTMHHVFASFTRSSASPLLWETVRFFGSRQYTPLYSFSYLAYTTSAIPLKVGAHEILRPMERRPYIPEDAALPEPLTVNVDRIPHRLQEYDHFVVWHYERVAEELKKPPCDPKTGKRASVRKPETWGSFQEARHAYESGQFAGVGIVLTAAMGIVGIDIDHCIVDGQLDEEAHPLSPQLLAMLKYPLQVQACVSCLRGSSQVHFGGEVLLRCMKIGAISRSLVSG